MSRNSKVKRDVYYQLAKKNKWRARSAYKLLQIDEKFNLLDDVVRAVDLCAAPGSWSQVLSRRLYLRENLKNCGSEVASNGVINENAKIVAVDILKMTPLEGVTQIQGDITEMETVLKVLECFEGVKADLVVCDGAPDVSGMGAADLYLQSKLLLAALSITLNVLRKGGNFVAKMFRSKEDSLLKCQMLSCFEEAFIMKPDSSRSGSNEAFLVCRNYLPADGFDPALLMSYLNKDFPNFDELTGINRVIIPYIMCGDINGFFSESMRQSQTSEKPLETETPKLQKARPIFDITEGLNLKRRSSGSNDYSFETSSMSSSYSTNTTMHKLRYFAQISKAVLLKKAKERGEIPQAKDIDKRESTYVEEFTKFRKPKPEEESKLAENVAKAFDRDIAKEVRAHKHAVKLHAKLQEALKSLSLEDYERRLELCDGYLENVCPDDDFCGCDKEK